MYRGSERGYTFGSFTLFFYHLGEVRGQILVKGEMIMGFVTIKSLIIKAITLRKTDPVVLPPCLDLVF